jgi:hypothetical protein
VADRKSARTAGSGGAMRAFARWVGSKVAGRQARPGVVRAPDGVEDPGVGGVGGPAMREPGSTGVVRALKAPSEEAFD